MSHSLLDTHSLRKTGDGRREKWSQRGRESREGRKVQEGVAGRGQRPDRFRNNAFSLSSLLREEETGCVLNSISIKLGRKPESMSRGQLCVSVVYVCECAWMCLSL